MRRSAKPSGMKDEYVSTEHLLLGIVADTQGAAGRLLKAQGVTQDNVLQALVTCAAVSASPTRTRKRSTGRWKNTGAT